MMKLCTTSFSSSIWFWHLMQVGTVLNVEDARKAVKAGAEFLMSPATVMVGLNALQIL